jgi:hypothetical protein
MQRLVAIVHEGGLPYYALEIFLRREPTDVEFPMLLKRCREVVLLSKVYREDLPDELGVLFLNFSAPGEITPDDHGEAPRARLGFASAVAGPSEHHHIVVRVPFTDKRADEFLTRKARQFPADGRGLVMIDMRQSMHSIQLWEEVLSRRFQPSMHRRVGAVCLFGGAFVGTSGGHVWRPFARLLVNPHARSGLPSWLTDALARWSLSET